MMLPRAAGFSEDGQFRYWLGRGDLRAPRRACLFICLNPSKAGGEEDDPSLRKMCGFAQRLDCDVLLVGNLAARVFTDPADLASAWVHGEDVIGPECDRYLASLIGLADVIIAGWGVNASNPAFRGRPARVLELVGQQEKRLLCLGRTKGGHPIHPLMHPYLQGVQCVRAGLEWRP